MKAAIEWRAAEKGGRQSPPSGVASPPYSAVIRFLDDPWPPEEAWTVVVKHKSRESTEHSWVADVHYLFDDAPQGTFVPGRKFKLYEGRMCVASGELLE